MNIIRLIEKIKNRVFGKIEYHVEVVNVSMYGKIVILYSRKDLNEYIKSINESEYDMVRSVKKYRKFDFVFNGLILHSPVHFDSEGITESKKIKDSYNGHRYLKKDESTPNVKPKKSFTIYEYLENF